MNAVDIELRRVMQQLTLGSSVKPVNLREERERFLKAGHSNRSRSPKYRYENDLSVRRSVPPALPLESMNAPDGVIDVYREKEQELGMMNRMFAAIGSDDFTRYSVEIFGAPTDEDARKAHQVLEKLSTVDAPERDCTAEEFATHLKQRISLRGIAMDVKLDPSMTTKVWVDGVSRGIHLNRSALFACREIERLLVHEVDVHAVRIHNGSCFPWGIFAMGAAGYREAEEGLAVYYEQQTDRLYPFQEKVYAGRCWAVHLSLSFGFEDVFAALLTYFDENTAFSIVERIKRGTTDTSRPGALTKDFHYFTGPQKVRSFLAVGGDLQMLMGGKIAFKHTSVVSKLVQETAVDVSKWIFPTTEYDD